MFLFDLKEFKDIKKMSRKINNCGEDIFLEPKLNISSMSQSRSAEGQEFRGSLEIG